MSRRKILLEGRIPKKEFDAVLEAARQFASQLDQSGLLHMHAKAKLIRKGVNRLETFG